MKITISCPDDTRIIGVITVRGSFNLEVDQELREAKDGLVINTEEKENE